MYKAAVITVSDTCSSGEAEDISGSKLAQAVSEIPASVEMISIVPDETDKIAAVLTQGVERGLDFIFTTGGTGISPRDVTPEATLQVLDKEIPGIGELLRLESLKITKSAALSRGTAGIAGKTLIINLPGSPKAVVECMEILMPVLRHAPDMLAGKKH
jgi:molybdopterin adenylyltransferase